GLDDERTGGAAPEQAAVEALAVDDDVGEAPAVAVASLDVALELHGPSAQVRVRVRRGFGPEALDGLPRMMRLGRVDAEQPDGVGRVTPGDGDRVAVDHVDDGPCCGRGAVRLPQPPAPE